MLTLHLYLTALYNAAAQRKQRIALLLGALLSLTAVQAQRTSLRGSVVNQFTKEKIPFASLHWKKAGSGTLSDSLGNFSLAASPWKPDTLIVSYVGFQEVHIPVRALRDTGDLVIALSQGKLADSVVVSSKYNKGLLWWRRIVKNKPVNNPYQYSSYAYELYNKVELDLNNISREGFNQYKLLRPFGFILENIDSVSESRPFLPIFMTESLSDYYYKSHPYQAREEIKAIKTSGVKNESVLQFLGGMNQRINTYENYLVVFGKEFISPLSSNGDNYYNYRGADTQYISGERYFHLYFTPRRDGENTFSGDCWVHSRSWAIKKITLDISATANINYVNRLSIIQEFTRQNDSSWVFAKDKLVADISPMKKNKLSIIARKTSMYRDVQIDKPFISNKLN
ncbi:MAG: carboxypeptidase-like regulatory domain-containing protein, partial [Bacteroidetes bacterium]|nr:carboxypeptidase-like regulatory domain-containing protein [Bacteroidota bacterium]